MLDTLLLSRLEKQRQLHLWRERQVVSANKSYIHFSSNDYLGLSHHPDMIAAAKKGLETYGVGSGASPLITGYQTAHETLENAFAAFLGRERALLFSTGYMANIGVLQALTQRQDMIFQDKLNHASLIDAGQLSAAKSQRYRHRDMQDLENRLEKSIQNKNKKNHFIVTESVFSMEGSVAPLNQLSDLSQKHNAILMVDDAHGIGVLGNTGRGALEHFHLTQKEVPILVCPLGKAFGCAGAIVSGSQAFIDSLIQFSRSYIYTTAMPPVIAVAITKSLMLLQTETWRREKLKNLIAYFKLKAKEYALPLQPSDTAIQSYLVGDSLRALKISQLLLKKGVWVTAIRPPTVPPNTARLRITLTCHHEKKDIDALFQALVKMNDIVS